MERVIIKPCLFFRFNGGYGDEIAITILQDSARGIGLSKRQSIWEGGIHPADLDGHIGPPDPRAGTPWCFAYGETEWVAGKKFDKI